MIFSNIVLSKFGIDFDVKHSFINKIVVIFFSGITTIIAPLFLTAEEQGYYFTFLSILALQVFFEAGIGFVFLRKFAHENAHIKFDHNGSLIGAEESIQKIRYLFKYMKKWYFYSTVTFFLSVPAFGIYFFKSHGNLPDSAWIYTWFIVSIITGINLFISAFLITFTGLGHIGEVAKVRTMQTIITFLTSIPLLTLGYGINFLTISMIFSLLISLAWLYQKRHMIRSLSIENKYFDKKWVKDIYAFHGRVAISWICGYFIFNSVTPYIFYSAGASDAGKTGLCLIIFSSIMNVSITWLNGNITKISHHITLHNHEELNNLFKKLLLKSVITYFLLFTFILILVILVQHSNLKIKEKFFPFDIYLIVGAIYLLHLLSSALALYVRSLLKEPFSIVSVFMAISYILILISEIYQPRTIFILMLSISLISSIWIYYIFKNNYKKVFYRKC